MFARRLCALAVLLVLAGKAEIGVAAESSCSTGAIPEGFVSDTVQVEETTLHYVSGGRGAPLILLHGFPENWSAYAGIIPKLADKFHVVAVDLRGGPADNSIGLARTGGREAGETLLTAVADSGAELLVMGAYGHSRLSEMILGGATKSVLKGMKCPVLFSH